MKTTAKDFFTTLYEAFHKLDKIQPPENPELTASRVEVEVYEKRCIEVQKEIEDTLEVGAKLLDKYVDRRILKLIAKMKYDGDLK